MDELGFSPEELAALNSSTSTVQILPALITEIPDPPDLSSYPP